MNRRLPAALLVFAAVFMSVGIARGAESLACLGSQVGTVAVQVHAHVIDNGARQLDQGDAYQGVILGDLQALGLRTVEANRGSREVRSVIRSDDQATIRIGVSIGSIERRLTSVYLTGDQWPLRTVTLTVSASATDARTGTLLAAMDIPAMNLAGNSTTEAVSDYLVHDFRDALKKLLGVVCNEPSMTPLRGVPVAGPLPVASRGGNAVAAAATVSSLRINPGRHIAIVIGVSRYLKLRDVAPAGSHELTNLHYADADAQAMGELLQDAATTGRHWEVATFVNQEATKDRVSRFMKETFENARSDDVILLFFAGHGRPNGATDVMLMTYDSDPDLPNEGLSFDWVKERIAKSPALQIIGFIDACHSGSSAIGGVRGSKGSFDPDLLRLESDVGKMRTVIASASNEEAAYEDDAFRHGVFTYYLLQAIKGAAPHTRINGGDFLLLGKIYDYVYENVRHHVADNTKRFGPYATQRPASLGNLEAYFNNWPFARAN